MRQFDSVMAYHFQPTIACGSCEHVLRFGSDRLLMSVCQRMHTVRFQTMISENQGMQLPSISAKMRFRFAAESQMIRNHPIVAAGIPHFIADVRRMVRHVICNHATQKVIAGSIPVIGSIKSNLDYIEYNNLNAGR